MTTTLPARPSTSLRGAVLDLVFNPGTHLIREWNWKAALFSAGIRAPIFFISDHHGAPGHAAAAMLAEAFFAAAFGGFLGSITQRLRDARPRWATAMVLLAGIPLILLGLQYAVHLLVSPQKLRGSLIAGFLLAALSTGFNWYAMEQGTLLTDGQQEPLGSDMRHMPRVILNFLLSGPRAIAGRLGPRSSRAAHR